MKVILLQKIKGLGDIDDIKEVADGYAINFLFPKHLAVQASPSAEHDLKAKLKRVAKESEYELKDQQQLAEKLDALELAIKAKANDDGLLYAAIGPQKIAELLKAKGCAVIKSQIFLKPIKEAGDYKAKVKLRHGLEAEVSITVSV
ncbi:MAG: Ribosomal protein L9 [Candidatus Magasanikbacteria bacterium GW2011_GWA2_37_8]|uniref:Large ribosomal subunit protein bL9 n=1 Tax=Candidatus Magasanikbacteria bacterium GW2011_GWA2_37_8 TaxID=1619036 RepID=A0A0G0HDI6_9BACT|nr:MAG: Ribosomal protein L9 [Candidatus Magasanikbacteria bacterium GW2011_GWA2_37_8]